MNEKYTQERSSYGDNSYVETSAEYDAERYFEELSEYYDFAYDKENPSSERRASADRFRDLLENISSYNISYDDLLRHIVHLQEMVYALELREDEIQPVMMVTLSYPGDISGTAEGFWNYLIVPFQSHISITRLNETGNIILTQIETLVVADEDLVIVQTSGIKKGWYPYQQHDCFWAISEDRVQAVPSITISGETSQDLVTNGGKLGTLTAEGNKLLFEPCGEMWFSCNIATGILSVSENGKDVLWFGDISYKNGEIICTEAEEP